MSDDRPKRDTMSIEDAMILNTLRLAALMKELEPESSRSEFEELEFALHFSGYIGWPMAVYFRLAALIEEREPNLFFSGKLKLF